jgi:hypothetical protein
MASKNDDTDLSDVLREVRSALEGVGREFRDAFEKWQEDAQYHFDKEFGKQLAKHPELYAELKKTYRQVRKGLDKTAKDLGLK